MLVSQAGVRMPPSSTATDSIPCWTDSMMPTSSSKTRSSKTRHASISAGVKILPEVVYQACCSQLIAGLRESGRYIVSMMMSGA